MQANYKHLAKKAIAAALEVEPLNNPALTAHRIDTCKANAQTCYNASTGQCKMCGCFIEVKASMAKHRNPLKWGRIELTHCPKALWGRTPAERALELEIANSYRALDGKHPLPPPQHSD